MTILAMLKLFKTIILSEGALIYFIVNLTAGSGKAAAAVPLIEKIMLEHNAGYSLVYTNAPGDFPRISSLIDLNGAEALVCVGGDGTVQEYAGMAVGRGIKFGVIPAGSGNDLLYSLPGGERNFSAFEEKIIFHTRKIIKGDVMPVDAVSVSGGKYFFNIAGTGIDIQVLKDALPLKKIFGGASYFISLIKNAVTYKTGPMTLTVDGVSETDRFLLLAVCNGAYYGGHMRIAPPASVNDGFITLCKVRKMPRLKLMTMFPRVRSGGHASLEEVSFVNCKSVKLEFEGRKTINLDGNLVECESPLSFEIVKDAVRFIV